MNVNETLQQYFPSNTIAGSHFDEKDAGSKLAQKAGNELLSILTQYVSTTEQENLLLPDLGETIVITNEVETKDKSNK